MLGLFAGVEDAHSFGGEKPFVRAGGVEVAVEVVEVHGEHSGGLGAVYSDNNAMFAGHFRYLSDREDHAVGVDDVAHGDNFGVGGDGVGVDFYDLVRGFGQDGEDGADEFDSFGLLPVLPGDGAAGVFVVGQDDFIAGFEVEAGGDNVHALGGVVDESDLFGGGAQKIGCFGSDLLLVVLPAAPHVFGGE